VTGERWALLAMSVLALTMAVCGLLRWWHDRQEVERHIRLAQADWRAKVKLANAVTLDGEKANRRVAVLPFHRTCTACGAAFERSPMVVDMRCDACQAKAFDATLEADRDDWSKGGTVIKKGWQ
jgi:hypothetical protein